MSRTLQVEVKDELNKYMSLHVGWVAGKDPANGTTFDLSCGAGLGSSLMFLVVEHNGERVREVVDMQTVVTDWVTQIVDEIEAKK